MKCATALLAAALLVLCAIVAGCTSPTATEIKPVGTTTVPTAPPTLSTAVVTVVGTPDATETLPSEQYVDLSLYKQRPDSTIHLTYNGGKGAVYVQNVMMKVTLSNGEVIEKYLNDGSRKPRIGDELVVDGTRGTDHVQVFVTTAGKTYKVIDESVINTYYQ